MIRKLITGTILSVLVFFSIGVFAQDAAKADVILKLNGDELTGKISEISETEVKFSYSGETLVYAIKKVDILKITFASGRIEIINKQPLPSESKSEPAGSAPTKAIATSGTM